MGVGLDSLKVLAIRIKLIARIEHYGGDFSIYEGGGYVYTADGTFHKTQLALSVFPIHFNVKKLLMQFGLEYGRLLFDQLQVEGVYRYYRSPPGWKAPPFGFSNSPWYLGLRSEFEYPITLENIILKPKYFLYYGFFTDFLKNAGHVLRSVRHGLGVAIVPLSKK